MLPIEGKGLFKPARKSLPCLHALERHPEIRTQHQARQNETVRLRAERRRLTRLEQRLRHEALILSAYIVSTSRDLDGRALLMMDLPARQATNFHKSTERQFEDFMSVTCGQAALSTSHFRIERIQPDEPSPPRKRLPQNLGFRVR